MSATLKIPQDKEAEECLVGCLIHEPQLCLEHSTLLGDHLFNVEANLFVFQAVAELGKSYEKIEFEMLVSELKRAGRLEEIGGRPTLVRLWDIIGCSAGWRQFYEDCFKVYRRRRAVIAADRIIRCEDPDEQEKIGEESLRSMLLPKQTEFVSLHDGLLKTLEWLENENQQKSLVTFGISQLDGTLHPIEGGAQVVICAETGGGKSALAAQAALRSRGACAIFSLEMPERELHFRMLAHQSGIPLSKIRRRFLSDEQRTALGATVTTLGGKNIWIHDGPHDFRTIASKCRILKNKGLELIVVDYLQLVTPAVGKKDVTREREVAEISRSLKLMAMDLGIATIVLSQLNDDGKLRESRAIGQDADVILAVNSNNGEIEIIKQRNGPLGVFPVAFNGPLMRFSQSSVKTEHRSMSPDW